MTPRRTTQKRSRTLCTTTPTSAPWVALALALALALTLVKPTSNAHAAAARYLIEGWGTEDGLPQNIVHAVAQTPDGFLWCATPGGLARFDGIRFVTFNAASTPALGTGRIRALLVDRQGVLWACTQEGGLIRRTQGIFESIPLPPPEGGGRRTFVGLADDASGTLWLSSEDGAVFTLRDGVLATVSGQWPARAPFTALADARGGVWVRSRFELAEIRDGTRAPVLEGPFAQYQFLAPSREEGWWVKMGGRVRLWRAGQWLGERAAPAWADRAVPSALEDRQGRLWVGTSGLGLFRYDPDGTVEQFAAAQGLGSDQVNSLCEDREGNLWVGTSGGGLRRVRPALVHFLGREQGFASNQITAVCEGAQDVLWVGTENDGLHRVEKGRATLVPGSERMAVRSVLLTRKGTVWVGAAPGGLHRMQISPEEQKQEPQSEVPKRDRLQPASADPAMAASSVLSLLEDRQGRLWVGRQSPTPLLCLDSTTGIPLALPTAPESSVPTDVVCMAEDTAGRLWMGTDGHGLFSWDGKRWSRLERSGGLPSESVRALHADADGSLWIGTEGGGLCWLRDGRLHSCNTKDGLLDDTLNFLAEDLHGRLWMTSFQGVFHLAKKDLTSFFSGKLPRLSAVSLNLSDGLPALECPGGFQPAGCRSRDGRIWVPTLRGLAVMTPTKPQPTAGSRKSANPLSTPTPASAGTPPVHIESISIDGAPEDPAEGRLELLPGRHRYEIRYTGIHLGAPARVQFRHKLEGFEKKWVEAGTRRVATYNYLPAGRYQFEVQARTQDGDWNPESARMELIVPPRLWERTGFLPGAAGSLLLLVAAGVRTITRRRFQRRLREIEAQRRLEAERTRIAQDIHDDLGAGLTQIGWLGALTEKQAADTDTVRAHARKIAGTARDMVRSLDEIVWAVRPENDSLQALIDYFGHRVDEFFDNSPVRAWFTPPAHVPHLSVPAELRHHFYLACKEALHNVLKHSAASEVRILLHADNGTLRARIEDNGYGLPAKTSSQETSQAFPAEPQQTSDSPVQEPSHRGNGLPNMRQRVENLGGRFHIESAPGKGTVVKLEVPLPAEPAAATP